MFNTRSGSPKRFRAAIIASGMTLSNAFAQSSASSTSCPSLDAQTSSRRRLARKTASAVPLLDLNPNCVGQMRSSAPACFRRSRTMLAKSLYPACSRQIGR
eukprot:2368809-Pyramimonas_sp.AAC.2